MRLFVALHLDPQTQSAIEAVQAGLRSADFKRQVRWVDPRGIHLTLKFLGEVPDSRAPEIGAALEAAVRGQPPCRLAVSGVGGFPNLARARVIWLGMVEDGGAVG